MTTEAPLNEPAPDGPGPDGPAPIGSAPIGSASIGSAPIASVPIERAPDASASIGSAPGASAPIERAPIELASIELASIELAPVEHSPSAPPPSREPAPDEPRPIRRQSGAASWAFGLALATWALAVLCSSGLRGKDDPPENPDARRGYYAARATFAMFPACVGLAAVVASLVAMRAPADRKTAASALGIAGVYLLLVGGAALYFALSRNAPYVPPPPRGPPLTDAEVRAFARRVEQTIAAGDATFFDSRLDGRALIDRAFAGTTVDPRMREGALTGLQRQSGSLGKEIVRSLGQDGGTYVLLRVGVNGDRPTTLFRLIGPDGVNYHDLTLGRGEDGQVSYEDLHVFLGGFRMTEVLRRLATADDGVDAASDMARMAELVRAGKPRDALAHHDRLPPARRDRKELLLARLAAAAQVGEAEHMATLAMLERAFPNDPGVEMTLLDAFLSRGDRARALRVLDSLDASVGGDPYLAALQANVLLQSGEPASARSRAQSAIDREPTLRLPHEVLLDITLEQRDHAATATLLTRLEADFGLQFGDLSAVPVFASFVGTPEHAAWLAARRGRPTRDAEPADSPR